MSREAADSKSTQRQWSRAAELVGIKGVGALLTYAMFAMLARAMTQSEYGAFSTGFAGATVAAQVALFGQSQLLLRQLPRSSDDASARGLVALSVTRFATGLVAVAVPLASLSLWSSELDPGPVLIAAAAIGAADLAVHALRARDHVALAFGVRDILWRAAIIGVAWLWAIGQPGPSAAVALAVCAAVLACLVSIQMCLDPVTRWWTGRRVRPRSDGSLRLSAGYWINAMLGVGLPNLATVMVGMALSVEEAALFFAAFKSAQAMQFLPVSMTLIVAPRMSRSLASGDLGQLQMQCQLANRFAVSAGLPILVGAVMFGGDLLGLFGTEFRDARTAFTVLVIGFVVAVLSGPTKALMNQSGNPASLNRATLAINAVGLAALPFAAAAASVNGVAAVLALSTASVNVWARWWIMRHLRVESSVLCLIRGDGLRRRRAP